MVLILNRYRFILSLCICALPLLAFAIASRLLPGFGREFYHSPMYILLVTTTLAVWAAAAEYYQLASTDEWFRESTCLRRIFPACVTTYLIVIAIWFVVRREGLPRGFLLLSTALLLVYTPVVRRALLTLLRIGPRRTLNVLIVGTDWYARRRSGVFPNSSFPVEWWVISVSPDSPSMSKMLPFTSWATCSR